MGLKFISNVGKVFTSWHFYAIDIATDALQKCRPMVAHVVACFVTVWHDANVSPCE
jgi:hypothetical protein